MKINKFLATILIIIFLYLLVIMVPYFILSEKIDTTEFGSPQDFSHFSSYFGGMLTPFLTFISTTILIYSLIIERRNIELLRREKKSKTYREIIDKNKKEYLELKNTEFTSAHLNEKGEIVNSFKKMDDLMDEEEGAPPDLLKEIEENFKIYAFRVTAGSKEQIGSNIVLLYERNFHWLVNFLSETDDENIRHKYAHYWFKELDFLAEARLIENDRKEMFKDQIHAYDKGI